MTKYLPGGADGRSIVDVGAFRESHWGETAYEHSMRSGEETYTELYDHIKGVIVSQAALSRVSTRARIQGDKYPEYFYNIGFSFGMGLHTYEDSYCRSHAQRSGNTILWFQEYSYQRASYHTVADLEDGSPEYWAAYASVRDLLELVLCNCGEQVTREMIDNEVKKNMVVTPATKFKGSLYEFSKKRWAAEHPSADTPMP